MMRAEVDTHTYTLTRTRLSNSPIEVWKGVTALDMRHMVTACARLNLDLSHYIATGYGARGERALTDGEPFVMGIYTFNARKEYRP